MRLALLICILLLACSSSELTTTNNSSVKNQTLENIQIEGPAGDFLELVALDAEAQSNKLNSHFSLNKETQETLNMIISKESEAREFAADIRKANFIEESGSLLVYEIPFSHPSERTIWTSVTIARDGDRFLILSW